MIHHRRILITGIGGPAGDINYSAVLMDIIRMEKVVADR